eukprot:6360629-Pyramimonas_sp.AAC.1
MLVKDSTSADINAGMRAHPNECIYLVESATDNFRVSVPGTQHLASQEQCIAQGHPVLGCLNRGAGSAKSLEFLT